MMIYIGITAAIFVLEFLIKNRIEQTYNSATRKKILGGRVILQKYHNHGAFLNFLEKKKWIVKLLSVLLTVFCVAMFLLTLSHGGSRLLKTGLALLLGGAFSNTYDRLHRKYVVDYFSLQTRFAGLNRVVFNLADFAIIIGCLITALAGGLK